MNIEEIISTEMKVIAPQKLSIEKLISLVSIKYWVFFDLTNNTAVRATK